MSDQNATQVVSIHGKDVTLSGENLELVINSPKFTTWAEMISPAAVPDEITVSRTLTTALGELTFAVLDLKLEVETKTVSSRVFLKPYLIAVLPVIEVEDEVFTILVTHQGGFGEVSVVEIPTGVSDENTRFFKHPVTHWLKGTMNDFVSLGTVVHPSLEGRPEVIALYALEVGLTAKAFAEMKEKLETTSGTLIIVNMNELIGKVTLDSKSEVAYHRYVDMQVVDRDDPEVKKLLLASR